VSDLTRQHDIVEHLKGIPEIVECHYITGSYNLMVKLYCLDNEHLMRTIFDKILVVQGVSSTQTYMSLNEPFCREIHVDCIND
jgi:Lrp/AsnC family transcriptional regulator for asnA, asnC and gidA